MGMRGYEDIMMLPLRVGDTVRLSKLSSNANRNQTTLSKDNQTRNITRSYNYTSTCNKVCLLFCSKLEPRVSFRVASPPLQYLRVQCFLFSCSCNNARNTQPDHITTHPRVTKLYVERSLLGTKDDILLCYAFEFVSSRGVSDRLFRIYMSSLLSSSAGY